MNDETRKTVAAMLRALAQAGKALGDTPIPIASPIGNATAGLLELVAKLVERVGVAEAATVLQEVLDRPAEALTEHMLDEDVARVARELGLAD